jgi:hypothetical protein
VRENEGGRAALRFSSIQVRDGGHRWHPAWRRGQMGGSGLGVLRKEKGPRWAGLVTGNGGGMRRLGSTR